MGNATTKDGSLQPAEPPKCPYNNNIEPLKKNNGRVLAPVSKLQTTFDDSYSSGSSTESGAEADEKILTHESPITKQCPVSLSSPQQNEEQPVIDASYMLNKLRTSPQQIDIIIQLWNRARSKGPNQPGASILGHIVIAHPALKQVFYGDPNQQLFFEDFDMSLHAQRFTEALDDVITNLSNPAIAIDKMRRLGAKHVNARKLGFQPEYWNAFAQALITQTLDWNSVSTIQSMMVRHTWIKIVGEIMHVMKKAYSEELKKRQMDCQESDQ